MAFEKRGTQLVLTAGWLACEPPSRSRSGMEAPAFLRPRRHSEPGLFCFNRQGTVAQACDSRSRMSFDALKYRGDGLLKLRRETPSAKVARKLLVEQHLKPAKTITDIKRKMVGRQVSGTSLRRSPL